MPQLTPVQFSKTLLQHVEQYVSSGTQLNLHITNFFKKICFSVVAAKVKEKSCKVWSAHANVLHKQLTWIALFTLLTVPTVWNMPCHKCDFPWHIRLQGYCRSKSLTPVDQCLNAFRRNARAARRLHFSDKETKMSGSAHLYVISQNYVDI